MIEIDDSLNEARLTGTLAWIHAGPGQPRLYLCDGPRPAFGGSTTVLCAIDLANPAGVVSNNTLTLTPTDDFIITSTGIAVWAMLVNGNGKAIYCDVSAPNGGGEAIIPDTQLYAGGYSRLVSGAFG